MKFSSLFKSNYYPLNKLEISADRLLSNYQFLSNLSDQKIAPVLKSNAYGHGLITVAKILDNKGAPFFCVDSLYEAYELLKAKITTPILIMGYVNPYNLRVKSLPFSYVAYDIELVETLNKYQPGANIHIFVDTGMHREGILLDELSEFLRYAQKFSRVNIEGLISHFGMADNPENVLTKMQIENFQKAKKIMAQHTTIPLKWTHISASDGLLYLQKYIKEVGNLARIGLALYGFGHEQLKPVLELKTTLAQIKTLQKGEKIGYDFTFTAPRDMIIGVLPTGYYDGVDRRLSNTGYVTIDGHACRIIGRVSMNITVIDVSNVINPYVGQEVVVYSHTAEDKNSFSQSAKLCDTIPYELLVHLSSSTKRKVL